MEHWSGFLSQILLEHPVADADMGLDEPGMGGIGLDLLPQGGREDPDGGSVVGRELPQISFKI